MCIEIDIKIVGCSGRNTRIITRTTSYFPIVPRLSPTSRHAAAFKTFFEESGETSQRAFRIFDDIAVIHVVTIPSDGSTVGSLAVSGHSQIGGSGAGGLGLELAGEFMAEIIVRAIGYDSNSVIGSICETFNSVGVLCDNRIFVEGFFTFCLVGNFPHRGTAVFGPAHSQAVSGTAYEGEIRGSSASNVGGEVDDVAKLAVKTTTVSIDTHPVMGFGDKTDKGKVTISVSSGDHFILEILIGGIFHPPGSLIVVNQSPAKVGRRCRDIGGFCQSTHRVAGRSFFNGDVIHVGGIAVIALSFEDEVNGACNCGLWYIKFILIPSRSSFNLRIGNAVIARVVTQQNSTGIDGIGEAGIYFESFGVRT